MTLCERSHDDVARIIERAHQADALRPDFTGEDLLFIFGTNALPARASKDAAPGVWRCGVGFMLGGLRAEAAHPLPSGLLTSHSCTR